MIPAVAVTAALAAAAVVSWPRPVAAARLARVVRGAGARAVAVPAVDAPRRPHATQGARVMAVLVVAVALALLVGRPAGVVLGCAAALALHHALGRLEPATRRRRRRRLEADAPVAAELLAACLATGCSPAAGAAAVSLAMDGPVADALGAVVRALRLGSDPATAWRCLEAEPPLAPLARAVGRAVETGAPLADTVGRLADDQREQRRWAAEAAARRVGVRATAPLGVCFLPAFVLLGVVPVVAGSVGALLVGTP